MSPQPTGKKPSLAGKAVCMTHGMSRAELRRRPPTPSCRAVLPVRTGREMLPSRLLPFAAMVLIGCLSGCAGGTSGTGYSGPTSLPEIRAEQGLPALTRDGELTRAAAYQAASMARSGTMSHSTATGGSFSTRMKSVSTRGNAAENIAFGILDTDEAFRRWMNSPPHRSNILNPSFTRYGLASAPSGDGKRRYWALVLAR